MKELKPTSQAMLEAAYQQLNYQGGSLIPSTNNPADVEDSVWMEKGDWLSLAYRIGADKIFFVNNDPVIVFFDANDDPEQLRNVFLKAWSMARPQCLFIAIPGEIKVYSLNRSPVLADEWDQISPLAVATRVATIAEELKDYRRELVEMGQVFAEGRFGRIEERADKRLIEDLKSVRRALINSGLSIRYTHSLIGRSIFIRYLEDRGILNQDYFSDIAKEMSDWTQLLSEDLEKPSLSSNQVTRYFYNILNNKEFTYALFRKLASDFNGDLFSTNITEEEKFVKNEHLKLLRSFLLGEPISGQQTMFFWAYDFSVIPIDLISSIYEEFYHLETQDDKGTHYTPAVLVDHVLSSVLTKNVLVHNPVVLDPACGSGIFLVEAFRRIVRFRSRQKQALLSPSELREVLRNQIRGIEIDREAAHIAAFSLYLALMHYQEPPAIQANPRLPKLIFDNSNPGSDLSYGVLFHNNTFDLTESERKYIADELSQNSRFRGRKNFERLIEQADMLPIPLNSCDIVVGNPPWGFVSRHASSEIRAAQIQVQIWCDIFDWSIGDNELSQAFIARTLSLLKPGGQAGLLLSSGILFKHHDNSERFRVRWLSQTKINKIVNFSHVRHLYFNATSPFLFAQFESSQPSTSHRLQYWSAKRSRIVEHTQAVILDSTDLHRVSQLSLRDNPYLWKVYWWGGHNDAALINGLMLETSLAQLIQENDWPKPRQGYTPGHKYDSPTWLTNLLELPISSFRRYGSINDSELISGPDEVHRRHTNPEIFSGWRILVKRGITEAHGASGRIEARLENKQYAFRNSVHAIKLDKTSDETRKLLIGILWSSLARYFFFMTGRAWGFWHHEIHLEELLGLPIRLSGAEPVKGRIAQIVSQLQQFDYSDWNVFQSSEYEEKITKLENELDEAVFELFELSQQEKDLIYDLCNYGLDYFYQHGNSSATSSLGPIASNYGTVEDLESKIGSAILAEYLDVFLGIWNTELEPHGEFLWQVIRPVDIPLLAAVFTTKSKSVKENETSLGNIDNQAWNEVLQRLSRVLEQEISTSIYLDTMIRAVTDTDIFIIKRDERRLWTRSKAREDAQATLLQVMQLQEAVRGEQ